MLRETFCTLILLKPALEVVQNERECNKIVLRHRRPHSWLLRDYWCGAVAQQYPSNVTLLSRYIVTLGLLEPEGQRPLLAIMIS